MKLEKTISVHPKKRFLIIFEIWGAPGDFNKSYNWYDTFEEAKEEMDLLEEFYASTPRPLSKNDKNPDSFANGERYWGYALLDFEEEKVVRIAHDGLKDQLSVKSWKKKTKDFLEYLDKMFRKIDEVTKGYKWDYGEYEGWLQFRWGDGKNAIGYIEPEKQKPEKKTTPTYDPILDTDYELEEEIIGEEIEEKFSKEIEREIKDIRGYKYC